MGQCLKMFESHGIQNCVRTTILYNALKGYSWGFLREWAIGQKPLLFWAIFTLEYKAKEIWTEFFVCLEYFTGKISWISLNIDVIDTLKHHFNLKCLYDKTTFWRLHAIVMWVFRGLFISKLNFNMVIEVGNHWCYWIIV